MKTWPAIFLFTMMLCGAGRADEFTPPEAYPINRYEAGWQKNPFTLKTAPPAIQRDSFAKDLTLGNVVQIDGSTTVTVVNTKTKARTRLHDNEPGPDGMTIKSVHLGDRKDIFVELAEGSESATVRYDEKFIQSMVAGTGGPKTTMPTNPMLSNPHPTGIPPGATGGNPVSPHPGNMTGTSPYQNSRPPLPTSGMSYVPTPERRRIATAPIPNRSH